MTNEAIVSRMFWLAYQAASVIGMGRFQVTDDATEKSVAPTPYIAPDGKSLICYADYTFGRMMKMYITFDRDTINISTNKLQPDYQSWCHRYETYEALKQAAIKSLEQA